MPKSSFIFSSPTAIFLILSMSGFVFVFGCEIQEEKPSYGLDTVIAMEMSSEELASINTGAYTKTPVSVPLWINNNQYIAAVNYAGATSVDELKRSFDIRLSTAYRGRTAFRLSAMKGDLSALRALLCFRSFSALGLSVPRAEPTAVWVNDNYAGLYLLMELYDDDYFDNRGIQVTQLYQAENGLGNFKLETSLDRGFSEKIGSNGMVDLEILVSTVAVASSESDCEDLAKIVDIENVLNYMVGSALLDNCDGIMNNYFLLRTEDEAQFRILPWDLDLSMVDTHDVDDGSLFADNALFSRLFNTESCGRSYADTYQEAKEILRRQRLSEHAIELANRIREAYEHDWYLSAGELTLDEHVVEIEQYLERALSEQ